MTPTTHATPPTPRPPTPPAATVTTRRQAGRRPRFSADDVIVTALRLGLDSFSVAAVARELGVTTAAVYRRFPSHKALLEECLTRILSEVPPLTGDGDWQDALRRSADEWWILCGKYPELPRVVSRYAGPVTRFITTPFQSYGQRLIEAGFTTQKAYFAASLLISVLDQVSRLPAEGEAGMSRDMVRQQAVEVIISGIAKGGTEWESEADGDTDL